MKKSVIVPLFYALFMILGHGRGGIVNAQAGGLNPYDGTGMKNGTQYAATHPCSSSRQTAVTGYHRFDDGQYSAY